MKTVFTSLQWMLFILMGSIIIPISIATTYGLDPEGIMRFLARALLVLGITGVLQAVIGHRLPIIEGPAGVWWSVYVLYAALGAQLFGSSVETLRALGLCFAVAGVLFIVLSLSGLVDKIATLFTSNVMGAYLVLMVVQLTGTFLKGMAGISGTSPTINPVRLALSFVIVISAFVFSKIKALGAYSTLCSILVGWVLFAICGQANPVQFTNRVFQLPEVFAFGVPALDPSMIVNAAFLTFLLLTNLLASISAMQAVFREMGEDYDPKGMRKAGIAAGIGHILASVFTSIGSVPISSSAAFVKQNKSISRKPFIIGNALIILISLSPALVSLFAALPVAVGYSALVPTFGFGTIGIALGQLEKAADKDTRNIVAGASWFIGIGIMFFAPTAYEGMNALVRTIISNGLIVGTIIAVVLDQVLTRQKAKKVTA